MLGEGFRLEVQASLRGKRASETSGITTIKIQQILREKTQQSKEPVAIDSDQPHEFTFKKCMQISVAFSHQGVRPFCYFVRLLSQVSARVFPSQNITCDCQAFLFLKVHVLLHFL